MRVSYGAASVSRLLGNYRVDRHYTYSIGRRSNVEKYDPRTGDGPADETGVQVRMQYVEVCS